MRQDEAIAQENPMTAPTTHRLHRHAACGRGEPSCVAVGGFWYGYFMTGVPVAMS
jgi:hypothetical protein